MGACLEIAKTAEIVRLLADKQETIYPETANVEAKLFASEKPLPEA
jgi:hypothetical protein